MFRGATINLQGRRASRPNKIIDFQSGRLTRRPYRRIIMNNWSFHNPVKIRFGPGVASETADVLRELGVSRAALVADPAALRFGLTDAVTAPAPSLFVSEEIYARMRPNPTVQNMMDCAAFLARVKADAVVAVGGGSALDCAKAAAGGLPVIALPTTAGTGSEATCISVLTDDEGRKVPRADPAYYPKAALVDPEFTLTVPPGVTAATGMDALSHAVEALWSIHHSPAADALALRAAAGILRSIEAAFVNPHDRNARAAMSEGSLLAALAFSQAKTAAAHACSFALTAWYGLPHGTACAFTLPALCRLNAPAEDGRLHDISRELGFSGGSAGDAAFAFADELDRLNASLTLPRTLKDAAIPLSDLPALAQECMVPPNMRNNPVPMDAAAIEAMFTGLAGE